MNTAIKTTEFAEEFYDLQVELNRAKKEMAAKNIGLRQINKLSDRVFTLCEKIETIQNAAGRALASSDLLFQGHKLMGNLEEKKKRIWDKDHKLLKKIHLIDFEIETLRDEILFVTDEETEQKLAAFFEELKTMQEESVPTPRLEKAFGSALDHLREVDFCLKFPIYQELLEDSFQENYIQRMQNLANDFKEEPSKALVAFLLLSDRQRMEVASHIMKRKGVPADQTVAVGPEDRAVAICDHIKELHEIASFAKKIFYEDITEPLQYLDQRSDVDVQRLEELFWQKAGKTLEGFQEEDACLLSSCLMELIEEKMMG